MYCREIYCSQYIHCLFGEERTLLFFKILRNEWIKHCQKVIEELKIYLFSTKIVSQLQENENLIFYLWVAESTLSSIIIKENEDL
jgi:hypothetical protein